MPNCKYEVYWFLLRIDENQSQIHYGDFINFPEAMDRYKIERDKILETPESERKDWFVMISKSHVEKGRNWSIVIKQEGNI